jgi:hypothetical protein
MRKSSKCRVKRRKLGSKRFADVNDIVWVPDCFSHTLSMFPVAIFVLIVNPIPSSCISYRVRNGLAHNKSSVNQLYGLNKAFPDRSLTLAAFWDAT